MVIMYFEYHKGDAMTQTFFFVFLGLIQFMFTAAGGHTQTANFQRSVIPEL